MSKKTHEDFVYHAPDSLGEALKLKAEYKEDATIFAGGTDIIPKLKALVLTPNHMIDLQKISELHALRYDEEGAHIGAMMTLHELETNAEFCEKFTVLSDSIHTMSSTQIRNNGTITGNICTAIPSADTAPALLALNAKVVAASVNGKRIIPIQEFFTGVGKTCLTTEEIVTEIIVPCVPAKAYTSYRKESVRHALDLAIVGVAGCVVVEDGVCTDCRIALGAVAVVPKRAENAEKLLRGTELTDEVIQRAAVIAATQDCKPISDIRATKEYRTELVRLATRDILKAAMNS